MVFLCELKICTLCDIFICSYSSQHIAITTPVIQHRSTFPFWPQISINTNINPMFSTNTMVYPNGSYFQPSVGISSPLSVSPRPQTPMSSISSPITPRVSYYPSVSSAGLSVSSRSPSINEASFSSNSQVSIL